MEPTGGGGWPMNGLPIGFGLALSMNESAMDSYSRLTEAEKEEIINRARDAKTKSEMKEIVDTIGTNGREKLI